MAATITPATDKQLAYLRKLVEATGNDIHQHLIDHGITKLVGFPHATIAARPPTKTEASRLIDELAPARTSYPRRRYGGQRRGSWTSYRCTHEDFPCCGCGPDAGR